MSKAIRAILIVQVMMLHILLILVKDMFTIFVLQTVIGYMTMLTFQEVVQQLLVALYQPDLQVVTIYIIIEAGLE